MAVTMRGKDIQMLGYQNVREVSTQADSRWRQFTATAMAGLDEVQANFIYLNSSARIQDLQEAKQSAKGLRNLHVLYAKSIEVSRDKIIEHFKNAQVFENVLWEKLSALFDQYLNDLKESLHYDENYVPPRLLNDSTHDIEGELKDFVTGNLDVAQEKILILKASAGVGKTTFSTKLAHDFAKNVERVRVIPIFIESAHWGKLHLESIGDLWEIILNSIGVYGSHVPISQDLFFYMVEQGLLAFIFDGFDELCGRRNSQFSASEMIEDLVRIASGSEAKILVTTRSLYWDREIGDESSPHFHIRELAAFNKQQAKRYFEKAFPVSEKEKRAIANAIYSKLSTAIHNPKESSGRAYFVNLPLCVALVSDYVKDGGKQEDVEASSPQALLRELMQQICKRETERQTLESSANEQIESLIELACLDPTTQNPMLSVHEDIAAVFPIADVAKIPEHPLLKGAKSIDGRSGDYVQFKYEFLAPFLRAWRASEELTNARPVSSPTKELMNYESGGKSFALEHLAMMISDADSIPANSLCESLVGDYTEAQSFIFHLLCEVVGGSEEKFDKSERVDEVFFRLCGPDFIRSRIVSNRCFVGSFHKLDLRCVSFRRCGFRDADFSTCLADSRTSFDDCAFSGSVDFPRNSEARADWALVELSGSCVLKFPASAAWNSLRKVELRNRTSELTEVFRLALNRFWQNGRPKVNVRKRDWARGSLGASSLASQVLDALVASGVVFMKVGAGNRDELICFNSDCAVSLSKFMNNNQLTGEIKMAWESISGGV